jgi:rod shape-determining protein MreD
MALFSSMTEQITTGLRITVPCALMGVLFVLNVVAVTFPLAGSVKAPLFLMGIYYWAMYRPTLMPAWVIFLAGCLMDLLSGLPIGLNALVFLVFQWVVTDQRRFLMGQNFIMIWFAFCLLSFAGALAQWAVFGLSQFQWPSTDILLVSTALGFALFPAVYIFLHLTHKILPSPAAAMRFNS